MFPQVVTKDPTAVEREAQEAYFAIFPKGDPYFVPQAFGWAIDCFTGKYRDYLPIDARYHDFEHTLQGTLCLMRLLHRRHLAGAAPVMTETGFKLGLLAILMHDTGYLKQRGDRTGTGAKYTWTHVDRSAEFAAVLLAEKGFSAADIRAVQNMIHCTGLNVNPAVIPFANELERIVGYALGTSDLLGQMAADDYVDKLPILYLEFEEAARYDGPRTASAARFSSAEDLLRKTPLFWERYVRPKIEHQFLGLYRFLSVPYPNGPNAYLQKIEANIARVQQQLGVLAA